MHSAEVLLLCRQNGLDRRRGRGAGSIAGTRKLTANRQKQKSGEKRVGRDKNFSVTCFLLPPSDGELKVGGGLGTEEGRL